MNVWESVWSYKTVVVVVEADVSLLWRSGYNLWCFFRCKFLLVCAVQELLAEFLLIELHFGAANEGSGRWPKIITENWDAMSCSTWKTLFDCIFLPQLSWKLSCFSDGDLLGHPCTGRHFQQIGAPHICHHNPRTKYG